MVTTHRNQAKMKKKITVSSSGIRRQCLITNQSINFFGFVRKEMWREWAEDSVMPVALSCGNEQAPSQISSMHVITNKFAEGETLILHTQFVKSVPVHVRADDKFTLGIQCRGRLTVILPNISETNDFKHL